MLRENHEHKVGHQYALQYYDNFTHFEPSQASGGAKMGDPREKTLLFVRASHFFMPTVTSEPCLLGSLNLYMDSSWKNS